MLVSQLAFAASFSLAKLSNIQMQSLLLKAGASRLLQAPNHTCQLSDNPSHTVRAASREFREIQVLTRVNLIHS